LYHFVRIQIAIRILSFDESNVEAGNIPAVEEKAVVT
jgi:hypothetical protein